MLQTFKLSQLIQGCADRISDAMNVDVTIVDQKCVRMAGTGPYRARIGSTVPKGSLYRAVLAKGEPASVVCKSESRQCAGCSGYGTCSELATFGYPISSSSQTVGVIGLIAFREAQMDKLLHMSEEDMQMIRGVSLSLTDLMALETGEAGAPAAEGQGHDAEPFSAIIGQSAHIKDAIARARRVAASSSTVLISGESGTGKELFARAIHMASPRAAKPFAAINCASIPETLLESELFGYERGAFTDADRNGKKGRLELAQHGTLFLDEIGDMPMSLQPKLLRVLQEKSFERIGGTESIPLDLRVVAATNKDLRSEVKNGGFREDLFYRLNVIPIHTPALREHSEDVPLYIDHFIRKYSAQMNIEQPRLSALALRRFIEYSWPGNVRELQNAVEYSMNVMEAGVIEASILPEYMANTPPEQPCSSLDSRLESYERELLARYLSRSGGLADKQNMADELGISLATLYRKIKKYNLE